MEDYGPVKKGTTMAEASYDTKPSVGMSPVEIYSSQSPIGDAGRGIHFGNKITEVVPKTGGGMGGAGGMTPLNPLQGSGLTPFGLKKGGFIDKPIQGNKKII